MRLVGRALCRAQKALLTDLRKVNIWSHGIGCIAYSSLLPLLMIYAVGADFHAATTTDLIMLGIFFSSVAVCFLCSTT